MAVRGTVVLVHGLWMRGIVMALLKQRLARRGYDVHVFSYATLRSSLTQNAERLVHYCRNLTAEKIHFVAHSMGGLVVLAAAGALPAASRGRIVLLGTPLADCYSGRRVQSLPGGPWLLGRCMAQCLREQRGEIPDGMDVGVVAGTGGFGMGRLVARGLPLPHDGVIALCETRMPGLRDHVVLPVSHTAMLVSRPVVHHVCAYLERGAFLRESGAPA